MLFGKLRFLKKQVLGETTVFEKGCFLENYGLLKKMLFENMVKINPGFKILNEDIGQGQLYYYVFLNL